MCKIGNLVVFGIIYKIINLVNGKVYIGQTFNKGGFEGRYRYSGKGIERVYKYYKKRENSKDGGNNYLLHSIEKYGFEAFEVNEVFDIAFSLEELNLKEQLYISLYNSDNKNFGYNHQKGGNNHSVNNETKKRMSEAKKGKCAGEDNYFYGKHHTEETKRKISEAKKGKYRGENNGHAIKIICINTGEIFTCIQYACDKYGLDASNLVKALKNPNKTSGNLNDEPLRWQYYDEYLKNPINLDDYKIICLNDGKTFYTCKEASEYYNCDSSAISKVVRGIWKHTHNLVFMKYTEYNNTIKIA